MNAPGRAFLFLCALALAAARVSAQDWLPLDPAQLLVIDTSQGRMVVEMRPDMAPAAVARIQQLSREGVYNGLQFHRVIEGFVAQTGNPNNRDGGTSAHPDLAPEFVFKRRLDSGATLAGQSSDATRGFLGSVPFEGTPVAPGAGDGPVIRAWGAYCTGVAGMGRQEAPGSANSEIFFMLRPARRLDRDYTVWGRVIVGLDVLQKLARGEPPARPDTMQRVQLAADMAPSERPAVAIASARRTADAIGQARREKGADFSICDVVPPVRYTPAP